MSTDSDHNPFQAPLSGPSELPPYESADCTVTPRRIFCKDNTTLPEACFFFGCTENVRPCHATLRTLKGSSVVAIIVFGVAMLAMMPAVPVITAMLLLAASLLLLILVSTGIWKSRFHIVSLTWYVGPKYRRRIRLERIAMRIVIVSACAAIIASVSGTDGQWWLIGMIGAAGPVAWFAAKPERRPTLIGKKGELFVVSGHSRKFCDAIRGLSRPF